MDKKSIVVFCVIAGICLATDVWVWHTSDDHKSNRGYLITNIGSTPVKLGRHMVLLPGQEFCSLVPITLCTGSGSVDVGPADSCEP
jgi:hypothetical protein